MATEPKRKSKGKHKVSIEADIRFAGIIDWENLAKLPKGWKLPTHFGLPDSDGRPVDDFSHFPQGRLMTESLRPLLKKRHPDKQYCIGQNSGIYWRRSPQPLDGVIVPDWFYVPDIPPMLEGEYRRSYVMWQEKKAPFLVLEFVSGTGRKERDDTPAEGKFWIYEQAVKATYYGIFDSRTETLELYRLKKKKYERVAENKRGHCPIRELGIELGIWEGEFENQRMPWLRIWDSKGNLLLHTEERLEIEQRLKEEEKQRADKLAERLRKLGIDPDQI